MLLQSLKPHQLPLTFNFFRVRASSKTKCIQSCKEELPNNHDILFLLNNNLISLALKELEFELKNLFNLREIYV